MNLCYIEHSFKHIEKLEKFVKSSVSITAITSIEELKYGDQLIISNEYPNYQHIVRQLPNTIIWEEKYKEFHYYSTNKYMENYDFYYLKYSLKKALEPATESIAVGSSYARFGIEESLLNGSCVNLALSSQDVYYACLISRYVISNNPGIKKVFLGTSYYYFYSDLSLTQGDDSMRVAEVYYPLLGDKHNCRILPISQKSALLDNEIFDIEQIVDFFCNDLFKNFKGKYFSSIINRFHLRMNLAEAGKRKWSELDVSSQKKSAYERAQLHNKCMKYSDSYNENKDTLQSFVAFCKENKVKVCVIAFPHTRFYKEYLSRDFKESYMSALDAIQGEIQLIDFNDTDLFTDEDFVDMDHLDKSGSIKISNLINELTANPASLGAG